MSLIFKNLRDVSYTRVYGSPILKNLDEFNINNSCVKHKNNIKPLDTCDCDMYMFDKCPIRCSRFDGNCLSFFP